MRALTIRQPYAWAVIHGGKDVENRKVAWNFTGTLAIHAGLQYAGAEATTIVERLADQRVPQPGLPGGKDIAFGAIVGVVDVTGVHRSGECGTSEGRGCSPWAEPFSAHLQLANPRPLPVPVACHGKQGLWTPEPHIQAAIRRQLP